MTDFERNSVDRSEIPEAFADLSNLNVAHVKKPSMDRKQDVRGHSNRQTTVAVIHTQPYFEGFDIPFRPADIALGCKSAVGRSVKNRTGALFARRQTDLELI